MIDVVVGVEARGFVFGAAVAHRLCSPFVPVRKPGKLPGSTCSVAYELEYGTDGLEIHVDAIAIGARVAIVDDVLATGGTAAACVDLVKLVNEVLALVGHMSRFRDRTITFSANETCQLEINGPQIKQVLLNLVANALESTGEGGRLDIELVSQTDQVTLSFADDGCGMTPETIENLFEPFFTTKSTGQGTGLGLSISHRIISDHGGTIEASSGGVGQGSQFRLQLPRRSEQIDSDWVGGPPSSEPGGGAVGKTIETDADF